MIQRLHYTHESRVWIFEQYLKEVGQPWSSEWKYQGTRPPNWTQEQIDKFLDTLHRKYEKRFPDLVINYAPSDKLITGSLKQQIQWTLTTQKKHNKMTRQLRLAAYEAGFLTVSDIKHLEDLQVTLHSDTTP